MQGCCCKYVTCADIHPVLCCIPILVILIFRGVFTQGDTARGGSQDGAISVISKGAVILATSTKSDSVTLHYKGLAPSWMIVVVLPSSKQLDSGTYKYRCRLGSMGRGERGKGWNISQASDLAAAATATHIYIGCH